MGASLWRRKNSVQSPRQMDKWKLSSVVVTVFAIICILHSFLFMASAEEEQGDVAAEDNYDIAVASLPIEEDVVGSGPVNDTVTWKVTEDEEGIRTLWIEGTGDMENYSNQNEQPWRTYVDSIAKVRIGNEITSIGTHCFNRMKFSEVDIGTGVEYIGSYSFAYGSNLNAVTIPGNVKKVANYAFVYHFSLEKVILEEGVESIGSDSFGTQNTKGSPVHLPASLVEHGENPFWNVSAYTVAEDNPVFCEVDGILYTKDMTILEDYPKRREAASFRIPDTVTRLGMSAISRVQGTKKLYIPASVQWVQPTTLVTLSNWEEIYIEDGVPVTGTRTFHANGKLTEARLPENTVIEDLNGVITGGCTSLTSFKIPNGTKKITELGSSLPALTELIYDAEDAVLLDRQLIDNSITYTLHIGEHVNVLPEEFARLSGQAEAVVFDLENQFTVEAGAFDGAGTPFDRFDGNYYIDSQGILYHYNAETLTAGIVYFQEGTEDIIIPDSITPEGGISYEVTYIDPEAFKGASSIRTVTFSEPENMTLVGSYAFADCTSLVRVNGRNTVEEAEAIFTSVEELEYHIFYNTGLLGASGSGSFETEMNGRSGLTVQREGTADLQLAVQSDGGTLSWEEEDGLGGYRLLTGDTLTITAATGNTNGTEDYVYRLYLQRTDSTGVLSLEPGKTYSYDEQEIVCYETKDKNTIYADFIPLVGKSISIPITFVYPSPDTAGGGLNVWGEILTTEEAEKQENISLGAPEERIQAFWTTQEEEFSVTKTSSGSQTVNLKGTSEGRIRPEKNLDWKIVFARAESTVSFYGKDYITSVDFQDKMTLPEGLSFEDEVILAIQEGNIRRSGNDFYAGSTKIANLRFSGGSMTLTNVRFSWDEEEERAVLFWSLLNKNDDAQMNTATIYYTVYPEALYADMDQIDMTAQPAVENQISAMVHYHYAKDSTIAGEAAKSVTAGAGKLSVSKTSTNTAVYFGETIDYTVEISNPGAFAYVGQTEGTWILRDTLDQYTYLTADNMEQLLKGSDELTIEISNADLLAWEERQGIWRDSSSWSNGYNSGSNEKAEAKDVLTIQWRTETEDYYAVAGDHGYAGENLSEILQAAGYARNHWTVYTLEWKLNDSSEIFRLEAGESRRFIIPSHTKDTFSMLTRDEPDHYPIEEQVVMRNYAEVMDGDGNVAGKASVENKVKREAYIGQRLYMDGEPLEDDFVVEHGKILDYQLELSHYGQGIYEDLPMVDDLYGAQALLVPVEANEHLKNMGLQIHETEEAEYFVLSEGTYRDVCAGTADDGAGCIAHEIVVESAKTAKTVVIDEEEFAYTGLHTRVKWYYPELEKGNYKIQVNIKTLVDTSLVEENYYTIANALWMNDREHSRLYSVIFGGGTVIEFDKEIVLTKGSSPDEDILAKEEYSMIRMGEDVTYRLYLSPKGQGHYVIKAGDVADRLPQNGEVFSWRKDGNVSLSYVSTHESTKITNLDQWMIADAWDDMEEEGQQYLLWDDTMSIQFEEEDAEVYIYVTLSYPKNREETPVWSNYASYLQGTSIMNTFYVYQYPARVIHHLYEEGEVLLQKGVYGMSYTNGSSYRDTESRIYYNNKDGRGRQIIYYVLLYNGGNKKFYLNDLTDVLPEGFTYSKLLVDGNISAAAKDEIITCSDFSDAPFLEEQIFSESAGSVVYKNAGVTIASKEGNKLTFHLSKGQGDEPVSYDEEEGRYYLEKNEAVLFGYMCEIGYSTETKDIPKNVIAMAYYDYLDSGVVTELEERISFSGVEDNVHMDQNDGTCQVIMADELLEEYGISGEGSNEKWLVSDVSVQRGQIIPGVTKYTDSYVITGNDTPISYLHSVGPYDTVNWRIRLHNSGTAAITDYTFADSMPAPYAFTGDISCTIYDYQDHALNTFILASIGGRSEMDEAVEITNNNNTTLLALDGSNLNLVYSGSVRAYLSMIRGDEKEEILKIHFFDPQFSIPEGGYMDIALSSKNPTTTFKNTVYSNEAFLIPTVQPFENVSQGSMTLWGESEAVVNNAPVTVSFGYATSSLKGVKEKEQETDSTKETNYIVLSETGSTFTYTLTVSNDTEKAMEKIVLIDPLPEPGDGSPFYPDAARNSGFQVSLSENLNLSVRVVTEEGDSYQLEPEYYSVDYSDKREFTKADWDGSSEWSSNGDKRSIRIVISDPEGEKIPPKSRVEISFDAAAQEDAEAGSIAWNSFGYHYKLKDVEEELEAMPLSVGVKIKEIPQIQKQMADGDGTAVLSDKDREFVFYIYEGDGLTTLPDTEAQLVEVLEREERSYQKKVLLVEAGSSVSNKISMADWEWISGKTYTVTEIGTDPDYEFYHFNGRTGKQYTFSYDPYQALTVLCQNRMPDWEVQMKKVDAANPDKVLAGAVFALYGKKQEEFDVPEGIEKSILLDGETWYFCGARTSDEEGKAVWRNLVQNQYYIQEISAPDGYNLKKDGIMLYRWDASDEIVEIVIENKQGFRLFKTGGSGTEPYFWMGVSLLVCACFLRFGSRKRKGDIV